MITLHPYQSVYFNHVLTGGLAGARGQFETDYWGASYREATEWVLRHYRPSRNGPVMVVNCSNEFLSGYFIDRQAAGTQFVSGAPDIPADIFLATERWDCHRQETGKIVHVVQRHGVPLAYVFE